MRYCRRQPVAFGSERLAEHLNGLRVHQVIGQRIQGKGFQLRLFDKPFVGAECLALVAGSRAAKAVFLDL